MARKYYYDSGSDKVGPVTGEDLVRLRAQGEIDNQTWVRRDDSDTWRHLGGINLKAEEEEAANPSLFKMLMRSGSGPVVLLFLAGIVAAGCILLYYAWPVLLVLLAIILLTRLMRV